MRSPIQNESRSHGRTNLGFFMCFMMFIMMFFLFGLSDVLLVAIRKDLSFILVKRARRSSPGALSCIEVIRFH